MCACLALSRNLSTVHTIWSGIIYLFANLQTLPTFWHFPYLSRMSYLYVLQRCSHIFTLGLNLYFAAYSFLHFFFSAFINSMSSQFTYCSDVCSSAFAGKFVSFSGASMRAMYVLLFGCSFKTNLCLSITFSI